MSKAATIDDNAQTTRHAPLTRAQREALIAECALGERSKRDIAKSYNIRPESLSRILREVKSVQSPSNPFADNYKTAMKIEAVGAVTRALRAKRDVYRAGDIGVRVLEGLGEFVKGAQVNVDGAIGVAVSWSMNAPAIDITPEQVDQESTT